MRMFFGCVRRAPISTRTGSRARYATLFRAAATTTKLPPPLRTHQTATHGCHWDRRLRKGLIRPDMSIDLHGHTLASAQALLDEAIGRGLMRGARVLPVELGRAAGRDRVGQDVEISVVAVP